MSCLPIDNIVDLDEDLNRHLRAINSRHYQRSVCVGPNQWVLPDIYRDWCHRLYTFSFRPDDVIIMGMPRSGTTLTEEIATLIVDGVAKMPRDASKRHERIYYLERVIIYLSILRGQTENLAITPEEREINRCALEKVLCNLDTIDKAPSPRIIKTHLPLELLRPDLPNIGCKIFYVCRNVKDVMLSYYKLIGSMDKDGKFSLTFDQFHDLFVTHNCTYFQPYWKHVEQAWLNRHHPNFHFVFYENLVKDMPEQLKLCAKFLNRDLSDSDVAAICNFLHFKNYQKYFQTSEPQSKVVNVKPHEFIRHGQTGGWQQSEFRDVLDSDKTNQWIIGNAQAIGIEHVYPGLDNSTNSN